MRLILALAAVLFGGTAAASVSHWVPFDNENGHITIPVTINGIESTAILDSGATDNGVSENFLQQHDIEYKEGMRVRLQGVYGERDANLINNIEVGLFGTTMEWDDLLPIRTNSFGFLIGLGFFNSFILQIDYPNSRLRIITRDVIDLKDFANVQMRKDGDSAQPIVRVNMNNERNIWLVFDTGSNGGLLVERIVAERAGWLEQFGTSEARSRGVTTTVSTERFRVPEVEIGPFVLENVLVSVPADGQSNNIAQEARHRTNSRIKRTTADGILGFDILKHFVVTIDYKGSLLHLETPQ